MSKSAAVMRKEIRNLKMWHRNTTWWPPCRITPQSLVDAHCSSAMQ